MNDEYPNDFIEKTIDEFVKALKKEIEEKYRDDIKEIVNKIREIVNRINIIEKEILDIRDVIKKEKMRNITKIGKEIDNDAYDYCKIGEKNYNEKDFKNTIKNYRKCLEKNPKNIDAWISIGKILLEVGLIDLAEKCFEKAYNMDNKNEYILQTLGEIHMINENYHKATVFFEKLLSTKSNDVNLLLTLVKLYNKIGDRKKAEKYLEKVLEIDPNNEEALDFKKIISILGDRYEI